MKILAISDTHGDVKINKKIGKIAKDENIDLILHAGDLTWFDKKQKDLIAPIIFSGKELFMVHGNHDSENILDILSKKYPLAKSIHGLGLEKQRIGFFGTGTTDWGSSEDSKKVFEELEKGHSHIQHLGKKVMVSHTPPLGSAIELEGFLGSYGVRKAIDKFKPDFLICGHIHEGSGLVEKIGETTVINAAFAPTIFEI